MKRLLTALVPPPLVLVAILRLPPEWFFLFVLLLVAVAVLEYARLGARLAEGVPLWVLLVTVPPAAIGLCLEFVGGIYYVGIEGTSFSLPLDTWPLLVVAMVPLGFGTVAVLARAPLEGAVTGLGLLAFGLPYFALPIAALTLLQAADAWLLLMMLAVVWLGDTFAFYFGTRFGRHKMAPVLSPNKSWEGAGAGLAGSLLAAVLFLWWQPGDFDLRLLGLAAVTAVAAQLGDLMESLIKRAAGVKDSGQLLPGHGGVLDRIDALLFAAPVWYLGLRLLGRLEHGL